MGFDAVEPEQRRRLKEALTEAGLETSQIWMKYFSIGGEAGEYEIDAYLNGSLSLPPLQRDILAHAANELIDDLPPRLRAPYCDDEALAENDSSRERRPRRDAGPDQE